MENARRPSIFTSILPPLLLAALVVATQLRSGCFSAEFGDDESSHYISGLMIHDYLASGLHQGPLAYLKWYHSHYPLIGIGHWGPAFYGVEALWMTLFSPCRLSVLLLSAVLTTATAVLIRHYGTVHLKLSRTASFFAAAAFAVCSITQSGSSAVMLDIPVALCCLAALIAYNTYLATERWRFSLLFGAIAAVAMLIKGNGMLLALLPPLSILLNRRWHLLKRLSFWAPGLLAGLVVGPWYLVTFQSVAAGFRYRWGLDYSATAIAENAAILVQAVGPVVLILAVIGLAAGLRRTVAAPVGVNGALALLLAVWLFQSTVPAAIQDRYLAPLLPPLFLLAALGGQTMAQRLKRRAAEALIFSFTALSLLPSALAGDGKPRSGLRDLAKIVWLARTEENPVVLIAMRESNESAAIAELAMADPARPSLFAVRGSRLLGGGGYNRADYEARFSNIGQVGSAIGSANVPLVLLQADPDGWTHVAQVEETRLLAREPWRLLGSVPGDGQPIYLYALPPAAGKAADIAQWLIVTGPRALQ